MPDDAGAVVGPFCVDAHAHAYPGAGHGPDEVFAAALRHARAFDAAAVPVLCLTQTSRDSVYDRWAAAGRAGGFELHDTGSPAGRWAERGADRLLLIAGRQLITPERLEVLAIGTDAAAASLTAADLTGTVRRVRDTGAWPVLPYGFGKWTGARGRTVRRLIDAARPGDFAVGDNGNRPRLLGCPRPLRRAAARGLGHLPGTDPLPLPGCRGQAGGYGVVRREALPRRGAVAELVRWFAARPPDAETFGTHVPNVRAWLQQVWLRWPAGQAGGGTAAHS